MLGTKVWTLAEVTKAQILDYKKIPEEMQVDRLASLGALLYQFNLLGVLNYVCVFVLCL